MKYIVNFLKQQWFGTFLIILFVLYLIYNTMQINNYKEDQVVFENKVKSLEQNIKDREKLIDSLNKQDIKIVEKIKEVKQKEYVKIQVINSLPVSGLQQFFTDRYPER